MIAPEHRASELRRARTLHDLRRYDEEIACLSALLAEDPGDARALGLLAAAQLDGGDPQAALRTTEALSAADPASPTAHAVASLAYMRLGDSARAIPHAERAVSLAPDDAAAHAILANVLSSRGFDLDRAEAVADRAARLAPDYPWAHIARGRVALARKRYDDAETAFRVALAYDPENVVARNDLARTRLRPGIFFNPARLAAAADDFTAALSADPTAAFARKNLDHVMRVFLQRIAWFVWFIAFCVVETRHSTSGLARVLPVLLLAIPGVLAAWFVRALPPALRTHLVSIATGPRLRVPGILVCLAVLGVIAAGAAPAGARVGLAAGACASAFLGFALIAVEQWRRAPARRPLLNVAAVLATAVALACFGGLMLVGSTDGPFNPVMFLVAVAFIAGAAILVAIVVRHRVRSADRV